MEVVPIEEVTFTPQKKSVCVCVGGGGGGTHCRRHCTSVKKDRVDDYGGVGFKISKTSFTRIRVTRYNW